MKWLLKFNIEEKMILGYLPVVLVIILIAALSLQSLQDLDEINKGILANDTIQVQIAEKMVDNLLAQEAYGRRYLILKSQQMVDMFWQRSKDFDLLVRRMQELPDQENVAVAQLASLHDEFEELYKQEFQAGGILAQQSTEEQGQAGQDTDEVDSLIKSKLDEIISLTQGIADSARRKQHQKMMQASTISLRTFRMTLLLSILGILLGLGAIGLITKSISRSIRQLKLATEVISQGRFDHLAEIETKDELGELALSFNNMTKRLGRLEEMYLDSNPLTRLPGGTAIENVLQKRLERGQVLAFCLLDLDNFKSYNDRYGYAKGNDVIRATARIIGAAVAEHGAKDDFVGHIGGDDFALISRPAKYEAICGAIVRDFDRKVRDFYSPEDRARGYIAGQTRQGLEVRFPLMSISIAVVTNEQMKEINHIEVAEIAAELKEHAKSQPGSVYVVNRRGKSPERPEKEKFLPQVLK